MKAFLNVATPDRKVVQIFRTVAELSGQRITVVVMDTGNMYVGEYIKCSERNQINSEHLM